VPRTRAIPLILRVLLLLGCLALAYVVQLPATGLIWVGALVAAGAVSTLAERGQRFGLTARAAEGLLCAAAVHSTGQNLSPFLPYLIAPVFAGGLRAGTQAAVITAGFEATGLLAGLAIEGTRSRHFSATAAQWIVIAVLGGLVGAWVRRLEDTARRNATTTYAAAHRLLSQLYDVMRQLPGSLDPVATASSLLDEIAEIIPYDGAAVLIGTGGHRLVPLAHRGEERLAWDIALVGDNPFAQAWRTEAPHIRATRFPRDSKQPAATLPGSCLVMPLRTGGRQFGVVGVESSSPEAFPHDPFPDEVVSRIKDCVEHSALRLDTGLLFDEVREVATTEERRRLAREIHDGIAQELASLGYVVDGLTATVRAGAAEALDADLARLRQEISRLVRELRLSIFELRSDVDRHGGLGAALSEYIRTIGAASGLTVHLTLEEAARRLPAEVEAELLRIAQEAINNARRHSTAENLWVTCRVDPPNAQLVIEDDGNGMGNGQSDGLRDGMGRANVGRDDSFGIAIMRERAARLRASLDIQPRDPRGTRVEVRVGSAVSPPANPAASRVGHNTSRSATDGTATDDTLIRT
jgi:signal transduction histidine kinase